MYEDRTQSYEAEIHGEYPTASHCQAATSFIATCRLQHTLISYEVIVICCYHANSE